MGTTIATTIRLLCLTFAVASPVATGNLVSWKNPVDGNWNDESKWSTGKIPSILDEVMVDTDGDYQITVNVHAITASLTMRAAGVTLNIVKSLYVYGETMVNSTVILAADESLYLAGEAIFNGDFNWREGGIEGAFSGQVTFNGAFHIIRSSYYYARRKLLIKSNLIVNFFAAVEGYIFFRDGAGIIISEGAMLNFTSSSTSMEDLNGGSIVNRGTITTQGTGIKIGVSFLNSGTLYVDEGDLSMTGMSTWAGETVLGSETTLLFERGKHIFMKQSKLRGATVRATSTAIVSMNSEQIEVEIVETDGQSVIEIHQIPATSVISIGDIRSSSSSSFVWYLQTQSDPQICFPVEAISVWNRAKIKIVGDICVQRLFQNSYSYQVTDNLDVEGDMTISESWIWEGGRLLCSGSVTVRGDTLLTTSYGKHIRFARVVFAANVRLDTSSTFHWDPDVNIIIGKDSKFTITASSGSLGSGGVGRLENYGELVLYSDRVSTYDLSAGVFVNMGKVRLVSAPGSTFILDGDVILSGRIFIDRDNSLQLEGQSLTRSNALIEGKGTLKVQGDNYEFQSSRFENYEVSSGSLLLYEGDNSTGEENIPSISINGGKFILPGTHSRVTIDTITITNGQIVINQETIIKTLKMSGGSLTGVGEVTVSDLFVWEAGTIEDEKGAKIKVEKDFQLSTAGTKVLKRQLIINGNATWVSTGMDISIDGRLTISEAASLRVIGNDFTLDATSYGRGILDNYGVFDVEMPFGAFHVDVEFNNYGSFVITSGDVKLTEKSDIRGILKFRDFSSTIHVMDGKHTIRPHSSSEDRLGKLKVENGFAEAIDCDWQEVMVAGNADVNMKYVSFTKPVIKSLSMEDGKTTVTSLSGSKIRLKNIVNDGGNIVLVNPVIATNVTMRGGVLETQNKMEIVGQFNWMAGTLRGGHLGQAQIVSNNELILIGSRDKILEDETFVVASAGSWKCAGDILMKRSTFVVRPTSNFLITGAGSIEDSEGTNVVWIKGSMELTSHTSLTLNTRFINDGIVTVSDGSLLDIQGSSTSNGHVNVVPSGQLKFGGGTHQWSSTMDNCKVQGVLAVSTAEVQISNCDVLNDINVESHGILTIQNSVQNQRVNSVTVDEDGYVTLISHQNHLNFYVHEIIIQGGKFSSHSNLSCQELTIQNRYSQFTVADFCDVDNLLWSAGGIQGGQHSKLNVQELVLYGDNEKTLELGSLVINTVGNLSGPGSLVLSSDSNFFVPSSAHLHFLSPMTLYSPKGKMTNLGTLSAILKHHKSDGVVELHGNFQSSGRITCGGKTTLSIRGASLISGRVDLMDYSSLMFQTGEHIISQTILNGDGTLKASDISTSLTMITPPAYARLKTLEVSHSATMFAGVSATNFDRIEIKSAGVFKITESVHLLLVVVSGGTIIVQKDTAIDNLIFESGTVEVIGHLLCKQLDWRGGVMKGHGEITANNTNIRNMNSLSLHQVSLTLAQTAVFESGFKQALTIEDGGHLCIGRDATFLVQEQTHIMTSDAVVNEMLIYGEVIFQRSVTISARITNFGEIQAKGGDFKVESTFNNYGIFTTSAKTETIVQSFHSNEESKLFCDGILRVNEGSSVISTSNLILNKLSVTNGELQIVIHSESGINDIELAEGKLSLMGDVRVTLDNMKIEGGTLDVALDTSITNLTMFNGVIQLKNNMNIDNLDFYGGSITSPSIDKSIDVQLISFHHSYENEKYLSNLMVRIGQRGSWEETALIRDTLCIEDGGRLIIMEGATLTMGGDKYFHKCNNRGIGVIQNHGIFEVASAKSLAPTAKTYIHIYVEFHNFGYTNVADNSTVKFGDSALLKGSFEAGMNTTIITDNHQSFDAMNLQCGSLQVESSTLVLSSLSSLQTLILKKSDSHVILQEQDNEEIGRSMTKITIIEGTLELRANLTVSNLDVLGGVVSAPTVHSDEININTLNANIHAMTIRNIGIVIFDEVNLFGKTIVLESSNLVITGKAHIRTYLVVELGSGSTIINREGATFIIEGQTSIYHNNDGSSCCFVNSGSLIITSAGFSCGTGFYNNGEVVMRRNTSSITVLVPDSSTSEGSYHLEGEMNTLTFHGNNGSVDLGNNSYFNKGSKLIVNGANIFVGISSEWHRQLDSLAIEVYAGILHLYATEALYTVEMPIKSLSILAGQVHFDEVSLNIEKMELTDGYFSGRGNVIVLLWKGGVISSSDMTVKQVVFQSDNSKTLSNANITIIENCKVIANTTLNILNGSYLMNQESSAIEINYPLKIYTGENGDGKFHSAGEIVVSTWREYETLFDLQFSSTGHLQMKRGQLLLKGSTSFTGSIKVEAKATLHFGQGTHDLLDSCSAHGRGSIVVDEGTSFDCSGNVTVNKLQISGNAYLKGAFCVGILRINGGTTELNGGNQANGGLSVGTLELHDGSLQCLGVAAINGPALLHGGQVSISGSFYANSYLHISNAVTILGNIDQQSDSCKGNTDCNSCSSLNLCTWHPSSNLCISKTRSGPQMCFQSSCSSGVQCFAYNDTGSCSSSADCVWCDWSNRCVRQEECSQSGDGVFWSSDGGGSWDEALNWHNGILPSEGSNVHIGYHSTNIVVRVNSQVSVKSISLGTPCDDHALISCDYTQELSIESTLTVSGNITVHKNGRLLLKGNLVINGMIVIHGQVVWTWGTISGEGSVYNDGQIDIFNNWSSYGNYHNTLAIALQNHGDVYYRSTRNQLKLGVSTITNHETGTFHLESTRPVQSGSFSNFGLLVVFVETYLTFDPVMHNHGKLQIMKGKLRLTSDTSCTGTIDIDADSELDFVNGIHDITTECTVEAGSATLRLSGSKVTFWSTLNSISLISVTGNSDLVVNQNLTVHKMYWEYAVIRGDGRIAIDELLQWKRATVECDVEIYGKSELLYVGSYYKQISDCNFRFYDDVFIADGPITLQLLGDSSLLIEAAAFIHIEHGHTVSVLSSGSQTSVYNYGKIVIDGTLQISSDFYSYGQISVELGALVLTKSSQITNGKVEMLTSGNIEFRGNNHEFLDDVHLNLQGTLIMAAQTLTIISSVCQSVGQFVATSGMTEIRNQTNFRSVGGIDLYRSTLSIETAFNGKLDVGSVELKYDGHLSLGTSCRVKNILFSGSGTSVNAIKTAVIEVYGSYTAFHGYSTRTARSVSTEEELPTWKIYGTMHPNGLNIGGNYEIHHSLIHTDGSFTLTNSVNLTIMAYAQVGLLGVSWSKSGSGVPRVTSYGAVHVFKTSNLNIPFHNHGSVQIYGNSGLRLSQDSNFTSGIINVMSGGWISFSGGSNHRVMQSCEINFAGDKGIYVYDRYTKLNLTQREFSDLYIDLNGAEANLYSSEPSNELKFLKFLKLIRGAHLNLHIGHMKVDKLHLEQSTIDMEGSELEVNILVTITGSSRDQSYLNGGKINFTQTTELHYPGTPTYSSVYVNVNTDLSIGDSSETLNLYGNVFYLKGTGTISNHRNTFIPENEVLFIYPFYQHIANMSIAGSLKVLGGGEISQTTLHFIHDGSFEVDGHDFYLTDVTFAGTGKILVHEGTLQISGQTMQQGYGGEGNLITLIAAGGNCKVDYLSDTSFVDILKLTKSGTVEINGNGHDNVGSKSLFFTPWNYNNAKMYVLSRLTTNELVIGSYKTSSFLEITDKLVVTGNMTWYSGIVSGILHVKSSAHIYFTPTTSYSNFLEVHDGHIYIDGSSISEGYIEFGLLDSVINNTNSWIFEGNFKFNRHRSSRGTSSVYNVGSMEIRAPSAKVSLQNNVLLENYGKIIVSEGTFTISSVALLGEVTVKFSGRLEFDDADIILNSEGSLDLSNSTLKVSGTSNINIDGLIGKIKHLYLDSGSVHINHAENLQIEMITVDGGTLYVNTDLHVLKVILKSGTIDGTGVLRTKVMDLYRGNIKIGSMFSHPGLTDMIGEMDENDYSGQEEADSFLIVDDLLITRSSSTATIESGLLVLNGRIRQMTNTNIQTRYSGVFLLDGTFEVFRSCVISRSASGYVINLQDLIINSGLTSDTGLDLKVPFLSTGTVKIISGKIYAMPTEKAICSGDLTVTWLGLFSLGPGNYQFKNTSEVAIHGSVVLDTSSYSYRKLTVQFDRGSQNIFIEKLQMPYSNSEVEFFTPASVNGIQLSRGTLVFHEATNVKVVELTSYGNFVVKKRVVVGRMTFSGGEIYGDGKRPRLIIFNFGWFNGKMFSPDMTLFNIHINRRMWLLGNYFKELDYNAALTSKSYTGVAASGIIQLKRSSQFIIDESGHLFHYAGTIRRYSSQEAVMINRGTVTSGQYNNNANILYAIPLQNSGKIYVDNGNLQLDMGGSSIVCEASLSSVIHISGGIFNITAGALTGAGRVVQSGGILAIVSRETLSMPVTVESGGTLQINSMVTIVDITIAGGTLRIHGVLTVTNILEFSAGTIEGDGILRIETDAALLVRGSTQTRASTIASLQNHGTLKIYSLMDVATGELRNEEHGLMVISERGGLTGNGLLTNIGIVEVKEMHPEQYAQINTALENIGWIKSNNSEIRFNHRFPDGQHFSVHSRMMGNHVTLMGTVLGGGVFLADTDISGNMAIPHAVVLKGFVTWSSGSIYGKDECQESSYNPASNSLMLPVCPEQYIINKGQLTLSDTGAVRKIGQNLDIINQGKVNWEGGKIDFKGPILNHGEIYVKGPSENAIQSNRYDDYRIENYGTLSVNDTNADLRSTLFSNYNTLTILHRAHLHIGSYIQDHERSLLHVGRGTSLEATTIAVNSGVMELGGSLLGNVDVGSAIFSILDKATVTGDLRLAIGTVLKVAISGQLRQTIEVDGDVTLNGKLIVGSADYTPAAGESFTILAFMGALSGQFSFIESETPSMTFSVAYGTSNVTLVAN